MVRLIRTALRHWRRSFASALILAAAILAFTGAFAVGYVELHRDVVIPGVQVGGVDLGGLGRRAAEARLREQLPDLGSGRLWLRIGITESVVDYAAISRGYDMTLMLDRALAVARTGPPADQLAAHARTLVGPVAIPAAVTWDSAALAEQINLAITAASYPPRDAQVARNGNLYEAVPDVPGTTVDQAAVLALAGAAIDNLSSADAYVAVETESIAADVPAALAEEAAGRANSIIAQPLTLSASGRSWTIAGSQIAQWLTLRASAPGEWQPVLAQGLIEALVADIKSTLDLPARDGTYTFRGDRPVVVPARDGLEFDATGSVAVIVDALLERAAGAGTTTLTLPTNVVPPAVSTAEAERLLARVERLSSWKTFYEPSARNGFGVNITRPTGLIDGTVVLPGEQFDFVAVAGPISVANGYTDGAAIINGNTRLDGVVGGGLCSASTTIFNAALRAGFQIDARRAHAYYIDRYPVGLDATIWVSGRRVQTVSFTNDSAYPILIRGINRRGAVVYEIYGVDDGRRVSFSDPVVTNERAAWTELEYTDDLAPGVTERVEYAFDGFDSVVTRTVTVADGATLAEDVFRSSYRRVIGLIRVGRQPDDPAAGTRVIIDH